jgi:transcriptional regulator with XRE-family HTH domain
LTTAVTAATVVIVTVSERLRESRERHGLSAKALDVKAGLTKGHTSLIESGRRTKLAAETAQKLAVALGVSLDWLLGGEMFEARESAVNVADSDPEPPTGTEG